MVPQTIDKNENKKKKLLLTRQKQKGKIEETPPNAQVHPKSLFIHIRNVCVSAPQAPRLPRSPPPPEPAFSSRAPDGLFVFGYC